MQDPCVAESKCPWLSGWDPAGMLGLLNGPALGAEVLGLLHHPGEVPSLPLPVFTFKVMSFKSFPLLWWGSGTRAAWVQSGWDMDVGSG